jgi:hypothetical protein
VQLSRRIAKNHGEKASPGNEGRQGREAVMNGFMEYIAFAGSIIASIGLALGLEWLGLNGLFRLMPGRAKAPQQRTEVRK